MPSLDTAFALLSLTALLSTVQISSAQALVNNQPSPVGIGVGSLCSFANENSTASVSCPGGVITGIVFARFETIVYCAQERMVYSMAVDS